MSKIKPFLSSIMILTAATTVFYLPFFLFTLIALFTLICTLILDYFQFKHHPQSINIGLSTLLFLGLLAIGLVFREHENLLYCCLTLSIFWLVRLVIVLLVQWDTPSDMLPAITSSTTVKTDTDISEAKLDALASMLAHIHHQQQDSAQNSKDTLSLLTELSVTLKEYKLNQPIFETSHEKLMTEKLNNVLVEFQRKVEGDFETFLRTKESSNMKELETIMDELNKMTNHLSSLDSYYMGQLQSLTDTIQLQSELIKDQVNTEVEILSNNEEFKVTILDGILSATKSIDICVFTLTNHDVLKALITKDIPVRMIIDGSTLLNSAHTSSRRNQQSKQIELLRRLNHKPNVDIRTFEGYGTALMHRKEMIIDEHITLSGSANYSRNAFERNVETMYVFKGSKYSQAHSKVFDTLWATVKEPNL